MTINQAEQVIQEWLGEEAESALLPYTEKLPEPGCWVLDGRFNIQKLAKKIAQADRVVPIRALNVVQSIPE
jgi:hypothetical protein